MMADQWAELARMTREYEAAKEKHEAAMLELKIQAAHDRLMFDVEAAKITARTNAMLELFVMEMKLTEKPADISASG
jgi:hypothetical protein